MTSSKATVYSHSLTGDLSVLSHERAVQILSGPAADKVSLGAAVYPEGGEIYVYKLSSLPHIDDIRCDQYMWRQTSTKCYPEKDPIVKRRYYAVLVDKEKCWDLRRIITNMMDPACDFALVQYIGDHQVYKGHTHGNSKNPNSSFVPESKSVKSAILAAGDTPCKKIYNDMQVKALSEAKPLIYTPKNPRKVINVVSQKRQNERLTHDAMYNIFALAKDLPQFVTEMKVHPQLNLHLVYTPLLQNLSDALRFSSKSNPMYFVYDTTFELGDFFVSVLSFRNPIVKGSPLVPVGFHIHERKFHDDHEHFVKKFFDLVKGQPVKHKVALVTDREFDFSNVLPDWAVQVYCWNHLRRNVREHVRYRTSGTKEEADLLADVVFGLLRCESEEAYEVKKAVEARQWFANFINYFNQSFDPVIKSSSGRWLLEYLGIFDPSSGITSNSAESVNAMIKRLMLWRERPIDVFLLSLYELSRFFENELLRGMHGLGSFALAPGLTARPVSEIPALRATIDPKDILESMKASILTSDTRSAALSDDSATGSAEPAAATESGATESSAAEAKSHPLAEILRAKEEAVGGVMPTATDCMAKRVIDEKRISLVYEQGAFIVEGSDKKKYAVTLHPQKCSCPATVTCYHIKAALLSIGADINPKKRRVVNMTLLSKRGRSAADSKSGRKRPRPADLDIVSAPDSQEAHDGVQVKCVTAKLIPAGTQKNDGGVMKKSTNASGGSMPPPARIHLDDRAPEVAPEAASGSVAQPEHEPADSDKYISPDNPRGGSLPAEAQNFVCSRRLPFVPLLKWDGHDAGVLGRMMNTCPIDNMLSLCYLSSVHDPNFSERVRRGESSAEKNLALVLGLMDAGDYVGAKKMWVEFLLLTERIREKTEGGTIDLWSSEGELFVDFFTHVFRMAGEDVCEHTGTCSRPVKEYRFSTLCPMPGEDVQRQVDAHISSHTVPCTEGMVLTLENQQNTENGELVDLEGSEKMYTKCNGLRAVINLKFSNPDVYMFLMDLHVNGWSIESALSGLPPVLLVFDKIFYLKGFTVNIHEMHFHTYVWMNGRYYFYDGMMYDGLISDILPECKTGMANFAFYVAK